MYALIAGLSASFAIGLLSLSTQLSPNLVLLIAPFGSTSVIVFGLPHSPHAQPKNVIFGHFITAFIGVCFVEFIGVTSLDMAIATGLAVSVMLITRTVHPPAGANPLLIMLTAQSWDFLFTTVLLGTLVMVSIAQGVKTIREKYV
ncbi:HPP family protein [Vibrio albus]|uniref:HPP family protein n=1 Tax=Vibrio albus TaxID=2200953 RepID=A0A2U3B6Y3_9VIBR|nr:HPP family protein [Vibrio albus]PWI32550.1 HPP family protein [Vibrio albus]